MGIDPCDYRRRILDRGWIRSDGGFGSFERLRIGDVDE